MADGYTLNWRGNQVLNNVRKAQIGGVNEIATLSATDAAIDTPVRTGTAQGSVKAEPARAQGNRVFTLWGSFNVVYYIWLELRKNMLRNAADKYYPRLADAIKRRVK